MSLFAPFYVPSCASCLRQRRRWLLAAVALTGVALTSAAVTGCASLIGPRTLEISREALLAKLGGQFPATRRVMDVMDISATAPRLQLLPDTNRVAAEVDLAATDLLMGQSYKGVVGLSFGLRYEPQDLSIRLTQVKVDQIHLAGLPALYQRGLTRLGAWMAEDRLQNYPIHRFKPEDLRTADRLGYEVGDIRVTAKGLAIQLMPRR